VSVDNAYIDLVVEELNKTYRSRKDRKSMLSKLCLNSGLRTVLVAWSMERQAKRDEKGGQSFSSSKGARGTRGDDEWTGGGGGGEDEVGGGGDLQSPTSSPPSPAALTPSRSAVHHPKQRRERRRSSPNYVIPFSPLKKKREGRRVSPPQLKAEEDRTIWRGKGADLKVRSRKKKLRKERREGRKMERTSKQRRNEGGEEAGAKRA